MSLSDSDDFEGFESAEEDLHVSDIDEDELDNILSEESSPELQVSNRLDATTERLDDRLLSKKSIISDRLEEQENITTNCKKAATKVESQSNNVNYSAKSQDVDNFLTKNTFQQEVNNELLDNSLETKKASSNLDSNKVKEKKKTLEDGNLSNICDNSRSDLVKYQAAMDNESLIKSVEIVKISYQTEDDDNGMTKALDSNSNGWNFEDDDIDLALSPEEENPSSQFSISSGKSLNNLNGQKNRVSGEIPFGTDDSGIDNNLSGWDFEEDLELPDSPEKKTQPKQTHMNQLQNTNTPVWPSWSGWGVSNLITSATEGVSTLTQMTSGLTSMLENTLGAPDPEVLATQMSAKKEQDEKTPNPQIKEQEPSELTDIFGFGNIIGGVKNLGNKVIDGGLETLETLGKKTMEVLQEGDPGLKKKRALLFQSEKVILSQVLRDAKEKAEASEQEQNKVSRKAQYETLFDDFHGLVHLEALEMISIQCEIKMESVPSNSPKCSLQVFNEAVNFVKQLYEQNDNNGVSEQAVNDDLRVVLTSCIDSLSLNINLENFIEVDTSIHSRLNQTFLDATVIHTNAISDLAQFTACSIELFHRIAELFIVKDSSDIENDFKAMSRIARVSQAKIGTISESYSAKLMLLPDKSTSPLITNVFLEASNSSTYLDNAFELFAPIFQLKALQNDISQN